MRIIKYRHNHSTQFGVLHHNTVTPIIGDLFNDFKLSADQIPYEQVQLLSPATNGQLYAIGLNYFDHVGELDFAKNLPVEPISFVVASSAIIGHQDTIILNDPTNHIDEEAELVVIIGKTCQNIPESQALNYVFGYTCGNDVSNRGLQQQDGQWFRGKSYPTYKPIGPWIETEADPTNLQIQAILNGQVVQNSNTKNLLFSVAKLIAFLSSFTILQPGDMIMTGTPQGVSQLHSGDTIEVKIQGIGSLINSVQ